MGRGIRSNWMIGLASLIGLAVYFYPFALPAITQTASGSARTGEAPLVLCGLIVLCLAAILREVDPMRNGEGAARIVALLASMVAIGAIARLIPSFLGASPLFLLVILGGYVFGPAFGFQLGALTLAVSAFLTGGIGPWVPYQMLGVGWVGMGPVCCLSLSAAGSNLRFSPSSASSAACCSGRCSISGSGRLRLLAARCRPACPGRLI